MQDQQEANIYMFTQLIATLVNALSSGQSQYPPSTHWIPPAAMRSTSISAWSIHQPPRAQPQQPMVLQLMQPPMVGAGEEAPNGFIY